MRGRRSSSTLVVVAVGQVLRGDQRLGQPDDALLVGVTDHERPVPVGKDFAQGGDFSDRLEVSGLDDGQRLVEAHGLALLQRLHVDVGRARQPHLAAGGEHVDGVVVVDAEKHAVATRRLTEPVDLLAQRQQLLTSLFEGFHQLGVPGSERIDPRLQLVHITGATQAALRTDRVLQLLAQYRRLTAQLFQLGRVVAGHRCPVGFRTL